MVLIPRKKTFKDLQECLYKNHPDIEILDGEYQNYDSAFKVRHVPCNYTWDMKASAIFIGSGCPKCGGCLKKTREEFVEEMKNINPKIEVLGDYVNSKTPILCKCKIDGYEWSPRPSDLLKHKGCPVCVGKVVLIGYNDFNINHPDLIKYLANKDDGYLYTKRSSKSILCKCPDCGYEKNVVIDNLVHQGFSCDRCSDGVSYPNKFIREVLRQVIGNDYICEYGAEWSKGYKYDVYFEFQGNKYIVEMDGGFHSEEKALTRKSLLDQQMIDKEKDLLAISHNIKIIRIDSRKSDQEYLKEQILASDLSAIFNLNTIDWDLCNKKGLSNIAKDVCLFFEDNKFNMPMKEMSELFHIYYGTFKKYIKEGIKYGWCTLTEEDKKQIRKKFFKVGNPHPINVFKDDELVHSYPSISDCAKEMTSLYNEVFNGGYIMKCIKRNRIYKGFLFQFIQ